MQTYKSKVYCNSSYGVIETKSFEFHRLSENPLLLYKIFIPKYESLLPELSKFLEPYEIDRAKRYYKETDKNRFIICRSLLKFALTYHTQSDIKSIALALLPNKKPYLPKHPNIFFNVSHSYDYAVLAISTAPIGIDIEYIDLNYSFQEVLPSVFTEEEIHFINNADHKTRAFYTLWTRKEAFVKALGKGIDDDFLKTPSMEGSHDLDATLIEGIQNWQVHGFEMTKNYLGAVAYAVNEPIILKPVCFSMPTNMEDLLKF